MAPSRNSKPPSEIRNTFYLTVVVVAAVLAGSVLIGGAIHLRRSSITHAVPITGKAVSRSVAKVVESRLGEARLRMLMSRGEATSRQSAKGETTKANPNTGTLSEAQKALTRIQKDPKARQEPAGETGPEESEPAVDTTPEGYLIARVTDERGHLVRQLAALIPVDSVRKLETPCRDLTQTACLRGDAAKDEETLRLAIVETTSEVAIGTAVTGWTNRVGSDLAVQKAWKQIGPGEAATFLLQALDGEAANNPAAAPKETGANLESAIARQIALDVAFVTLPAIEADWAARDIAARLAWGTAAVIFVGLWAAVTAFALHSIWDFTQSRKAVVAAVVAAVAAAVAVAAVQYVRPTSFELFGQLLRLLEAERNTRIAEASRFLNGLVASSLVLLLAAARAILRRSRPTAGSADENGEDPVVKADLAKRLEAFRTLFNTGALLLAAAAFEVATLYSWPGSVFDGESDAPASLESAALLGGGIVGALFSIVLILVYVPTQSVLTDWVRTALPATGKDLLDRAGFNDTTSQQFIRFLQAAAPMLAGLPVSGFIALLG